MDIFSVLYKYFFSYTGMGALGLMLCVLFSMVYCYKRKLEPVRFLFLFLLSVPAVYAGAKLFGILSLIAFKLRAGQRVLFSDIKNAGIVFYGGLFAYLLFMRLVLPVFYRKRPRQIYDCAVLLAPLFHGYARIGCYFAHCCYGVVSQLSVFEHCFEHRVPVQLIEAAFELCLFLILGFLLLRKKRRHISSAHVYLGAYSVFRFFIEFLRGDEIRGFIGPLSFSQWVSLGVVLYLFISHYKKGEASI